VWRLLGGDLRLRRNKPSFGSPGALIALLGLLAFGPACAYAVSLDAKASNPDDPGQSAYAAGRFIDALRIWRSRAEEGDARAAFGLGLLYDLGEGVGQDAAAAYTWYHRAAAAGYVLAEFNIAVLCDTGTGTGRNPAEAALWYARAAAHGYARAAYDLALLYEAGDGVPRNIDMAASWYAAAAAGGLPAAERKVAWLREQDRGAPSSSAAKPTLAPAVPTESHVTSVSATSESFQVELSWAAPAQPLPVEYFVEVLALDADGAHRAFTRFSKQSAVLAAVPRIPATYAWRIYTVAASVPDYVPSTWSYFSTRLDRPQVSTSDPPQAIGSAH
jgi:Sel1 repeat-containing protein